MTDIETMIFVKNTAREMVKEIPVRVKNADDMKRIKDVESAKRIIPTLRKHARPTFGVFDTGAGKARVDFYINHERRFITPEMDANAAWRICTELNALTMQ